MALMLLVAESAKVNVSKELTYKIDVEGINESGLLINTKKLDKV